jgi:Uma2 family endonuclease
MTPDDGWTLDNLPDNLPKHTELIRGVLVVTPQKAWHMGVVGVLWWHLRSQAPAEFEVMREMAVKRSQRSAPEPDLSIIRAEAYSRQKSIFSPEDFVMAAEVISPESEERDREDKPIIYAAMGIPTFWLIECGPDEAPIVHEHELYGGAYRLMRTHIGRLKTQIPFTIDIALEAP